MGPAFLLLAALAALGSAADDLVGHQVVPSAADPGVRQFDEPDIAITGRRLPADAPLVLFLSGTGGRPANAVPLMRVVAGQGYRVIGLEYNDEPAVVQVCPQDPDLACSADFRQMRIDGTGASRTVSNSHAEAIVPRLVAALHRLDGQYPKEGWGGYLDGDAPRWDRIVVSGLSQGAGMAAFIAKQHAVRRVVLFSSPWEFTGRDRHPAPWIAQEGATPPTRWHAEYNARENTVPLIKAAYAALAIPPANIRVFNLDLPANAGTGPNPYHGITIRDVRYAPGWKALYGRGDEAPPTP